MSTSQFKTSFTLSTIDTHILKTGQPDGNRPSIRTIELVPTAVVNGSITVKARPKGSSQAFVAVPYEKLCLDGTVGDGSMASTVITGAGNTLIRIEDTGLELALVCTSLDSGSWSVETATGTDS